MVSISHPIWCEQSQSLASEHSRESNVFSATTAEACERRRGVLLLFEWLECVGVHQPSVTIFPEKSRPRGSCTVQGSSVEGVWTPDL